MALMKMSAGVECDTAKDGKEALEKLEILSTKPDCIILDLNMPLMDGKRCLMEIRKNPKWHDIPVYMYTTSPEVQPGEFERLGANGYIVKPSSLAGITEIQKDLLARLQMHRA